MSDEPLRDTVEFDPEVAAAAAISAALSGLSHSARQRVLRWASDKFGLVENVLQVLSDECIQVTKERDALKAQLSGLERAAGEQQ